MKDAAGLAGRALHAHRSFPAQAFETAQGIRRRLVFFRQAPGERRGVLDRHRRALRDKGQGGMGGVPDQRHGAAAPVRERGAIEQRPFQPFVRRFEKLARRKRPVGGLEALHDLFAPAGRAPALVLLAIGNDGDDIDPAPPADRIMDQVGILAEPQMDDRRAELRAHAAGVDQRAPGGAIAELRARLLAKPLAQRGPQAVGADQGHAAFVCGGAALAQFGGHAMGM